MWLVAIWVGSTWHFSSCSSIKLFHSSLAIITKWKRWEWENTKPNQQKKQQQAKGTLCIRNSITRPTSGYLENSTPGALRKYLCGTLKYVEVWFCRYTLATDTCNIEWDVNVYGTWWPAELCVLGLSVKNHYRKF